MPRPHEYQKYATHGAYNLISLAYLFDDIKQRTVDPELDGYEWMATMAMKLDGYEWIAMMAMKLDGYEWLQLWLNARRHRL